MGEKIELAWIFQRMLWCDILRYAKSSLTFQRSCLVQHNFHCYLFWVFLPKHSELLCFIDFCNSKRSLFSSLAPPQTTSWHLRAFFFLFCASLLMAAASCRSQSLIVTLNTGFMAASLLLCKKGFIWFGQRCYIAGKVNFMLMICPQDEEKHLEGV